jgi:hypothetical protein
VSEDRRIDSDLAFAERQACNSHAVADYREKCVAAERALIRADVDALAAAWVRGDSVEVSRLLVKLRGES